MPRVSKTLIPRIEKSLRERGIVVSFFRSFLLPVHLFREYRSARSLRLNQSVSEFDRSHDVDTEGRFDGWTYLSDLDIPSPNWIEGNDYAAIEPLRFEKVLTSFDIRFEDFTFIDFGSGKGRALLLASEFPFKRIMGLEFSPELHGIAEANIRRYRSPEQRCQNIQSVNIDFTNFVMPPEPSILFFFNPCRRRVLSEVVAQLGRSLIAYPRPLYIAYVATTLEQEKLFASCGFMEEISRNAEFRFSLYRADASCEANWSAAGLR